MNGLNIIQRLSIALFKAKAKYRIYEKGLAQAPTPELYPETGPDGVHFRHSGLIGDIIYAIPAMLELAAGRPIHLHLLINQPSLYKRGMKHYNRDKILTEKSVEWLAPLLLSQPGFKTCDIYRNQVIHYDLDDFRKYPFDFNTNHICRWYFHTYGITRDLSQPWLQAEPDPSVKGHIVMARSFRYRAPGIRYDFLHSYGPITFLGLPDEYEDMKKAIPHLQYRPVSNFLEFARLVAGCRFFIGNQSFPFALAEALKVPRALELCFECPNVIPEGPNGYDFVYQPQFEKIIRQLAQQP